MKIKWLSFSAYVLLGFAVTLLLGKTVYGVFAQAGPNMEKYDPYTNPAIIVTHIPPLIVSVSDPIRLEFLFDCMYTVDTNLPCKPDGILYTMSGSNATFEPVALVEEYRDSFRVLVAEIPILDTNQQTMKYFLEINDPSVNIQYRYPLDGTIELTIVPELIVIDLPPSDAPVSGELVVSAVWGSGPDQVGIGTIGSAPKGPDAFDVAPNGDIALLDEINKRVILFSSQTQKISTYPVDLNGWGDITFQTNGELAILDMIGKSSTNQRRTPQLYLLNTESKKVKHIGSVFVKGSIRLTNESTLMDNNLGRQIRPLDSFGNLKHQKEQLKNYSQEQLITRWQDPFRSRFADIQRGLAFEIQSKERLGAILHFSKIDNGYVVVFTGKNLRILWLDDSGQVVGDVSVPNQALHPIYPHGRIAVDKHQSVYYLNTSSTGMEIRRVNMK